MKKTLGVKQFIDKKFPVMEFTGEWQQAFGKPATHGSWLVWGASGSGKTRFAVQLCKYLSKFGKVAYDSLEEGYGVSLQRAFRETNMEEVGSRVTVLDKEPMPELKKRLKKQKSPDIVIIDSFQYTRMTYEDYIRLKEEFPRKLFIFISHADGHDPRGAAAQSVRYDCEVKIRVEGYRATAVSRFGGKSSYTIWHEGAAMYWSEGQTKFNNDHHENNKETDL
jgi:hypothetical protein